MSGVCVAVVQLCSSAEVNASLRHLDDVLSDLKPGDVDAVFLPENMLRLQLPTRERLGMLKLTELGKSKPLLRKKPRV